MDNDETAADAIPNNAPIVSATTVDVPAQPIASAAANKKQKAAEDKARRDAHLLRLIENTTWQDAENFTVEDNVLKQIIGFDPEVFSVDMIRKICGKLGFVSRKYTKIVCLETILKAFNDLRAYNRSEPTSNTNMDSTSMCCRLLNAIISNAFSDQNGAFDIKVVVFICFLYFKESVRDRVRVRVRIMIIIKIKMNVFSRQIICNYSLNS